MIGLPDPKWGEAVTAVVVAADGAKVDPADLMAMVREEKGPVQVPKAVHFVDAIPLSAVGKPDKKALKARFLAQLSRRLSVRVAKPGESSRSGHDNIADIHLGLKERRLSGRPSMYGKLPCSEVPKGWI